MGFLTLYSSSPLLASEISQRCYRASSLPPGVSLGALSPPQNDFSFPSQRFLLREVGGVVCEGVGKRGLIQVKIQQPALPF